MLIGAGTPFRSNVLNCVLLGAGMLFRSNVLIVCACAILKDRPVCYKTLRLKSRVCAVTRCALLKTPTLKSNKR